MPLEGAAGAPPTAADAGAFDLEDKQGSTSDAFVTPPVGALMGGGGPEGSCPEQAPFALGAALAGAGLDAGAVRGRMTEGAATARLAAATTDRLFSAAASLSNEAVVGLGLCEPSIQSNGRGRAVRPAAAPAARDDGPLPPTSPPAAVSATRARPPNDGDATLLPRPPPDAAAAEEEGPASPCPEGEGCASLASAAREASGLIFVLGNTVDALLLLTDDRVAPSRVLPVAAD